MEINKKSLSHRITDNVLGFIFKNFNRLFLSVQGKIGSWFCPENDQFHFFDACLCESYCYDHGRHEITGCSVCGILEFNQSEFPHEVLEVNLCRVQNGFPLTEEQSQYEEEFYLMNKNKYFA